MKTTSSVFLRTRFTVAIVGLLLLAVGLSWAAGQAQRAAGDDAKRPEFVFISGQVNVPQRYYYTNGQTLGIAIKMASGLTAQAAPTKVKLTRGSEKPVVIDLHAIEQGKTKDIELRPDDKIFVPKR